MHDPKAESKRKIEKLIEHYRAVKLARNEAKYSEPDVETKFIEPFLEALGWNPRSEEVKKRYEVGRKVVDYALQVGAVRREPKILLEAKKFDLPEGLDSKERDPDRERHITYPEKVIQYAWNSRVEWAILTNFKELRVYNVRMSKKPEKALWFAATCDEFLDEKNFKKIWALSRESVATGQLDVVEIRWKRKPVDRQFLDDLIKCRLFLIENIRKNNKLEPELIKECAQRILDRLVIMRAAEDLGIETPDLLRREILKEKDGWFGLKQWLFQNFNKKFNSQIFAKHKCDDLEIDNEVIEDVVRILYEGTEESSGYLFDQIPADILGSMYEDYIGYILKEEGDVFKLEKEMRKRKAKGIYYTPISVVEFIVKNTLGTLLKGISPSEAKNIHILDPACGSGSFLIKAQDVLKEYYESTMKELVKKEGQKIDLYISKDYASLSKDILRQNIYGVDLDSQAAEIASVNLSLKVLADMKEKMKLPEVMGKNIKVGNSLISGSDAELRRYFENPIEKKPFNWKEQFPKVFEQDGFDVVIANPPYFNIQTMRDIEEKEWLRKSFSEIFTGESDIHYFFYVRALQLLKPHGLLGFISSRYFMEATQAEPFRRYLQKHAKIKLILDFGSVVKVFKDATINTVITIMERCDDKKELTKNEIKVARVATWKGDLAALINHVSSHLEEKIYFDEYVNIFTVSQARLKPELWILTPSITEDIVGKIREKGKQLGEICSVFKSLESGLETVSKNHIMSAKKLNLKFDPPLSEGEEVFRVREATVRRKKLENELLRPLLKNQNVRRYLIDWKGEFYVFTLDSANIEKYPNIKRHLTRYKPLLKERYDIKSRKAPWFALSNPRNVDKILLKRDRLVTPFIAPENRFVFISRDKDFVYPSDMYVIMPKDDCPVNLRYVLGILNSKLMEFIHKHTAKMVDGVARTSKGVMGRRYSYQAKYLSSYPILIPRKEKEKGLQNQLVMLADKMLSLNKQYNETLQTFQKILENIKDSKTKSKPFGKYYFKEGSAYGIDLTKTEKLIDTDLEGKVTAIEVEDEEEFLVLKAKYGDEKDFVPVIRMHIKDNALGKFFYYTMKTYLMEKVKTRMWGEGKIIDVVLNALEIPRFETNIEMDKGRIRKLMSEFFKSSPIKDKSLSEVGKEIQRTDSLIDQKVYGLYGLTEKEIKIIEESL